MKRKLLRFTLILLPLLLVTCVNEEIDTKGTIAGIVTDAVNGTPLKDASVALNPSGRTYTTGTDGRYEFKDIEFGSYTVSASKTNYVSDEHAVEVRVAETSNLDFQLKPANSQLEVVQKTLDFGAESTSLSLDIKNTGYARLTWQLTEDAAWLACNPTSGTVEAGKQQAVVVTVDRSSLKQGDYNQNITITSNGGSAIVQVGLTVQGIKVSVSPEELDFGATNTSLVLTLTNTGTGTVSYTLTPSNDWLKVSPANGMFTFSTAVTVTVNRADKSEGDYSGSLQLKVENNTLDIPVRMHIARREKPTVNLTLVDEITASTAIFKGAVVSIGSSRVSRHGFCWSTGENPEVDKDAFCNLGDCTLPKDFSYGAANLTPDSRYYVRAYAENDEGISYSTPLSFKTLSLPEAPTVETGSVSNILTNEAQVSGNIVKVGNDAGITQYGHVWDTMSEPTTASNRTELGATKATGPYTSTLNGLKANVTYHVRAYATNALGTTYGEDVTFTTIPDVVKLSTVAATEITHNEATLGGSISDKGGNVITERGVCYGIDANPTLSATHVVSSSTADRFSARLSGLTPRTTYHARAYVITEAEATYYGDDITFTTTYEIFLGQVGATTVSAFGTNFATFNGTIVSNGDGIVNDCGFVYALASSPTLEQGNRLSCGERQSGDFSSTATNLKENTTYYVRAYITNEKGTAYGEETSFTTLAITLPVLSTVTVSDITVSTAAFEAQVTDYGNGTLSDAGFAYSTSPNPVADHRRLSCGATSALSVKASGLKRATLYYVRAYAINEKGMAYSEQQSFTTPSEAISLTTLAATDILHDAATLGGSISDDGGNEIAERGVCYGTKANPDVNGTHAVASSTDNRFTVRLSGLTEQTQYHARAYATTSSGTTYYGNDVTFTTDKNIVLPSVSGVSISAVTLSSATFNSYITSDGGGTVSDCGFVYSHLASTSLKQGTVLSCGAKQSGSFTSSVNSLQQNTTYYVRSYVTNEIGTSYSKESTFATPSATFSVNPESITFTSTSSSKTLTISSNQSWTVSTDASWLTLSKTTGTGDGTLTITTETNATISSRSGTVTFKAGDKSYTVSVSQEGAAPTFSVTPTSASFASSGGSKTLTVTTNQSWTVSSSVEWVSLSKTSGSGDATLTITAETNESISSRSGTVTFKAGDKSYTVSVSQEGAAPAFSVTPTSASFASSGGSKTLTVTTNQSWTVSSSVEWVSLSKTSGTGDGTLSITAETNATISSRSGTVTFKAGDKSYTVSVSQEGAAPTFSVTPTSASFASSGGSKTLTVTSNQSWTVSSNVEWISLSKTSGAGDATLTITAETNATISSRSGTVTFKAGDKSYTVSVSQEGAAATFSVTPTSASFASSGGSKTLTVTTNQSWTVSSNVEWLSLSKTSGTGDATLTITAETNATISSRSGTVTFDAGDKSYAVNVSQEGVAVTFSVTPTSISFAYSGGSKTLTVTTNHSWMVSSDVSWISLSQTSGTGDTTLIVTAETNESISNRFATLTFDAGGISYTVSASQEGLANGHEYVDLGLPSGTLWATCNMGANNPEDYGDYYAWGEISPKSDYSESTYKWYCVKGSSTNWVTKYNSYSWYGEVDDKNVLDPDDDAAIINWEGGWRIPTVAEWEELYKYCTWSWIYLNGVFGRKVTCESNGRFIFLPAAGCKSGGWDVNEEGCYSSSSLARYSPHDMWIILFTSKKVDMDGTIVANRFSGYSIRPVCKQK